jgi:hypothetical protein
MERREIECGVTDWILLAQDRDQSEAIVNTAMILRVHSNVGKFLSD